MHRVLLAAVLCHVGDVVRNQSGLHSPDLLECRKKVVPVADECRYDFRQTTGDQVEFELLPELGMQHRREGGQVLGLL